MSTFLNLLTDYAFKKIFGQEENKRYLLSFLSAVLKEEIVDVEYNDKESLPSTKDERSRIFDIYCTTYDGRKLIVEMQNGYQEHFVDRALYYVSAQLVHQAVKGKEWNYQLIPVYGIFIMNFDWDIDNGSGVISKGNDNPFDEVGWYNYSTGSPFTDKARMYFLKLPFAQKRPEECNSLLEAWMYVLKNFETMDAIPAAFDKFPIFTDLGKTARTAALNEKERRRYERSLKVYRDNFAILETTAKTNYQKGREEGREEGRQKGREEGREEDIVAWVKGLHKVGVSLTKIAEARQLTIEEIKRILHL